MDMTEDSIPMTERWASSPLTFAPDPDAHPMTAKELDEVNEARRSMGLPDYVPDAKPKF